MVTPFFFVQSVHDVHDVLLLLIYFLFYRVSQTFHPYNIKKLFLSWTSRTSWTEKHHRTDPVASGIIYSVFVSVHLR